MGSRWGPVLDPTGSPRPSQNESAGTNQARAATCQAGWTRTHTRWNRATEQPCHSARCSLSPSRMAGMCTFRFCFTCGPRSSHAVPFSCLRSHTHTHDFCPPARPTGTNSQNPCAMGNATTLTAALRVRQCLLVAYVATHISIELARHVAVTAPRSRPPGAAAGHPAGHSSTAPAQC